MQRGAALNCAFLQRWAPSRQHVCVMLPPEAQETWTDTICQYEAEVLSTQGVAHVPQGWDVLLQRLQECHAALHSPAAPPSAIVQPKKATPFTSFILSHPLDAQSGLLIVDVVTTSHRGKPLLPEYRMGQAKCSARCTA